MEIPQRRALFLLLQHVIQIVLSGYGLRHSWVAITNLSKYEETTKKAAKWSNEIQRQLDMTRKTQAAGAITVSLSLVLAIILIPSPYILSGYPRVISMTTMLVTIVGARHYIKGFWAPGAPDSKGKDQGTRVPLPTMGDYNLAVQKTEDLLKCLEYLEYSWLIAGVLGWTIGWK